MRSSPNGLAAEVAENEHRLVTPDYPAWMASPFEPSAGEAGAGDLRFSRRDL
jgi:ABC-type cobalt transport system substrate-binding protein